jgi:hypothetical protein
MLFTELKKEKEAAPIIKFLEKKEKQIYTKTFFGGGQFSADFHVYVDLRKKCLIFAQFSPKL